MRHAFRAASAAIFVLAPASVLAQQAESVESPENAEASAIEDQDESEIVVTGARTRLPITALPLTLDVVGGKELTDQVAVSRSVVEGARARPAIRAASASDKVLAGRPNRCRDIVSPP